MNLQPKNKLPWHELVDKKFVAVYIALALVLVINQVVFSVLLTDRNTAKADAIIFGNAVVGNTDYPELITKLDTILPPGDHSPSQMVIDEAGGFAYIGATDVGGRAKIVKINLADPIQRVQDLTFDSALGLGGVATALIDNSATYAYFTFYSTQSEKQKVARIKISESDFIVDGMIDLPSSSWNYTAAITADYAYYGNGQGADAGNIDIVDLATFTALPKDTGSIHTGGNLLKAAVIDQTTGYAYFGDAAYGGGDLAHVYKIDIDPSRPSTLNTLVATITMGAGEQIDGNSLAIDGTNLWLSDQTYPAKLIKIDLSSFSRPAPSEDIVYETADGVIGYTYPTPPLPDVNGLFIGDIGGMKIVNNSAYLEVDPYVMDPDWKTHVILKIDLTAVLPLTPGDIYALKSSTLAAGTGGLYAYGIDYTNQKAYIAGVNYPAYVEKFDLSVTPMVRVLPALPLAINVDHSVGSVIDTDNGFVYVSSNYDPPMIAKIRLSDFTLVETLNLDNDLFSRISQAGIDTVHGFAYFNVTLREPGNPNGLIKVDINPNNPPHQFEIVGDYTIVDDLASIPHIPPGVVLIDPVNQKAYIAATYFPGTVTKVDLSTMTVETTLAFSLDLPDYQYQFNTGVIDVDNQFIYLGNSDSNDGSGRIIRVDLNHFDFVHISVVSLPGTEKQFVSSVIDTTNHYAYFQALWGKLVKIDIAPDGFDPARSFSRVGFLNLTPDGGASSIIDVTHGYAYVISGGAFGAPFKLNKIDIDPSRDFALINQLDIANRGILLIDPINGYFYLVEDDLFVVGVEKYSYSLKNYINAYKVTLLDDVPNVDSLRFYSNVDAASVTLAIYNAGKNLIWQSNPVDTMASTWLDVPVSNGLPTSIPLLTAGDYYLAFQTNTTAPVASFISGGDGFQVPMSSGGYGTFPDPLGPGQVTAAKWSFYGIAQTSTGSTGGVPPHTGYPGDVTNLQIKADSTGKVTVTWTDPTDYDLKEIVISETLLNGITQTFIYSKGTQTAVLTDRTIGSEYQYQVRARDTSGLESLGITSEITIPATGEVNAGPSVPSEEVSEIILPDGIYVGDRIKVADSTTVYFVDDDKRRHTFPNEPTYFSYFSSFNGIKTLPLSTIALIAVGQNVTVRPGTWLVKIQTDPKVYAVEPYGVLRYVSSVDIAERLYGADWTTRIIDISPAFFPDYQPGDPITTLIHPAETLIKYKNDVNAYYIDQGKKRMISSSVFTGNKLQVKFILTNFDQAISYPNGYPLDSQKIEDIIAIR